MFVQFIRQNYEKVLTAALLIHISLEVVLSILRLGFGFTLTAVGPIVIVLTPPYFMALVTLYVLIFTRSLRDEYVDKLWQRAARSFSIVVLTLPWLWIITWTLKGLMLPNAKWLPSDPATALFELNGVDTTSVAQNQLAGMDFVLGAIWTFGPPVFALLYKWHAWRDRI